MEEVLGMFQGVDKIYKDVRQLCYIKWTVSRAFAVTHDEISRSLLFSSQDISFVLEDYMELNFNTILEDGSTDELGELLVSYQRNIERMILYALKKVHRILHHL